MVGETDLNKLLKTLSPSLNEGSYVFATIEDINLIPRGDVLFEFKEAEAVTVIMAKNKADAFNLKYEFNCSWITLTVHSSLAAVGLTAAVATALTKFNISCNVVAAFYHDHIFVPTKDTEKAMEVLSEFSKT
jgi:hypothetical protein